MNDIHIPFINWKMAETSSCDMKIEDTISCDDMGLDMGKIYIDEISKQIKEQGDEFGVDFVRWEEQRPVWKMFFGEYNDVLHDQFLTSLEHTYKNTVVEMKSILGEVLNNNGSSVMDLRKAALTVFHLFDDVRERSAETHRKKLIAANEYLMQRGRASI